MFETVTKIVNAEREFDATLGVMLGDTNTIYATRRLCLMNTTIFDEGRERFLRSFELMEGFDR
jgi:hypothetical protein